MKTFYILGLSLCLFSCSKNEDPTPVRTHQEAPKSQNVSSATPALPEAQSFQEEAPEPELTELEKEASQAIEIITKNCNPKTATISGEIPPDSKKYEEYNVYSFTLNCSNKVRVSLKSTASVQTRFTIFVDGEEYPVSDETSKMVDEALHIANETVAHINKEAEETDKKTREKLLKKLNMR